MSCQIEHQATINAQSSKIKLMALRYQKYLQKQKENQTKYAKFSCALKILGFAYSSMEKIWKHSIPQLIKGPSTPYDILAKDSTEGEKRNLADLPLSKLTISESINQGFLTLVLTIPTKGIDNTLLRLENNEQINLLLRNKAQIIPVFPFSKFQSRSPVSAKIQQFLLPRVPNVQDGKQQYILVCWKGLFDEILILDFFSLRDPSLYQKVLSKIEKRREYESEIKQVAYQNDELGGDTWRSGAQKSTVLTKESSNRSQ